MLSGAGAGLELTSQEMNEVTEQEADTWTGASANPPQTISFLPAPLPGNWENHKPVSSAKA